jgi:hypothetical protein
VTKSYAANWPIYPRPQSLSFCLSANVAALILATWIAANPPEVVMQSRPGIDMQVGNNRLMGVVRRDFGLSPLDFGIFSIGPRNDRTRNLTAVSRNAVKEPVNHHPYCALPFSLRRPSAIGL